MQCTVIIHNKLSFPILEIASSMLQLHGLALPCRGISADADGS